MVGHTPESDIRRANAVNEASDDGWYSILVKTSVYQEGNTPRATVGTALAAVKHGMKSEMEGNKIEREKKGPRRGQGRDIICLRQEYLTFVRGLTYAHKIDMLDTFP